MEMISLRSSAISSAGYDSTTQKMKIKFKQGTTYDFCRVPQNIFAGLISSISKGSYYDKRIRDRYNCY